MVAVIQKVTQREELTEEAQGVVSFERMEHNLGALFVTQELDALGKDPMCH